MRYTIPNCEIILLFSFTFYSLPRAPPKTSVFLSDDIKQGQSNDDDLYYVYNNTNIHDVMLNPKIILL